MGLRTTRLDTSRKEGEVFLTREPNRILWNLFGKAKGTPVELVSREFCIANCQSKRGVCVRERDCIDAKECVHEDE